MSSGPVVTLWGHNENPGVTEASVKQQASVAVLEPKGELTTQRRAAKETAPTFNLRMPAELRQQLERECEITGRSLNAEIIHRLRSTLAPPGEAPAYLAAEAHGPEYRAHGDTERKMLALFRRLTPEKQLALLSLFK